MHTPEAACQADHGMAAA
jgi:hypothetical protein